MKQRYLFGPVPSRRLGLSLGVDLVPLKTCTLNCIYCECGCTTDLTVTRKEYVPVDAVLEELDRFLLAGPELDFITFAGSGEPTLHRQIDGVIGHIKDRYPQYPVALLTNGTLFPSKQVREQCARFDLIIPSLDAATEEVFRLLNRPHRHLECKEIIAGLAALRREYRGELCLEIFIVPGLNNTDRELAALKAAVQEISPDRVQLGTLDRPGAETWVGEASPEEMEQVAASLGGGVSLIEAFQPTAKTPSFDEGYEDTIRQTLRRRPCTAEDLSRITGVHPAEVQKYLRRLLAAGHIEMERRKRGTFLRIKKP